MMLRASWSEGVSQGVHQIGEHDEGDQRSDSLANEEKKAQWIQLAKTNDAVLQIDSDEISATNKAEANHKSGVSVNNVALTCGLFGKSGAN